MASPAKEGEAKPKFKSVKKKRPLRTRRDSDDETAEGDKDDEDHAEEEDCESMAPLVDAS